jgi:chemotaxis protein CheX
MKVEHLNPFLKSTMETFKVMIGLAVKPREIYLLKEPHNADVSSIIEITGDVEGKLVISYPLDVALKISSKFLAENVKELNKSVTDCIGEIANIISGFARKDFISSMRLKMSMPSVICGKTDLASSKDAPVICIPFNSEIGTFIMEIKMFSGK